MSPITLAFLLAVCATAATSLEYCDPNLVTFCGNGLHCCTPYLTCCPYGFYCCDFGRSCCSSFLRGLPIPSKPGVKKN